MTTKEKLQWLLAQENADGEANAQFAMLSRLSYDASAAVRGLTAAQLAAFDGPAANRILLRLAKDKKAQVRVLRLRCWTSCSTTASSQKATQGKQQHQAKCRPFVMLHLSHHPLSLCLFI